MACPSEPRQGNWIFLPQRGPQSALFIRLLALPSRLHARWLHAAPFTPSLIATWLFAPYDSRTSTTLFDRRLFFFPFITTFTIFRQLLDQRRHQQPK
jgi:hypothetical protein